MTDEKIPYKKLSEVISSLSEKQIEEDACYYREVPKALFMHVM